MPLVITPRELRRQSELVYEFWGFRVFLADNSSAGLTEADDTAAWLGLEPTGGGYSPVVGVVGDGGYNGTTGRWEAPLISWGFNATGAGFSYTHRALVLSRRTIANISTVARTGGTATVVTTAPHGFSVGQVVTIDGATEVPALNGTWTITAVPDWTTFRFALTGTTSTVSETGRAVRSTQEGYLHSLHDYGSTLTLAEGESIGGAIQLAQDN